MSFDSINWAIEQKIKPVEKLVLLLLANYENEETRLCCPKFETLIQKSGLGKSSVARSLLRLIELNLITRHQNPGRNANYVLHRTKNIIQRTKSQSGTTPTVGLLPQTTDELPPRDLQLPHGESVLPPREHNHKEPELNRKESKRRAAAAPGDPRFAPFIDFIFQRQPKLKALTHVSAFKELKAMLSKTKGKDGFSLEELKACWIRFERSPEEFHRKQGQPLRFFCTNLATFMNGNDHYPGKIERGELKDSNHVHHCQYCEHPHDWRCDPPETCNMQPDVACPEFAAKSGLPRSAGKYPITPLKFPETGIRRLNRPYTPRDRSHE